MENRGTSIVGWIALILSIIALVLAWLAYNRTGADLEAQIQQQVQEATDNIEAPQIDTNLNNDSETNQESGNENTTDQNEGEQSNESPDNSPINNL